MSKWFIEWPGGETDENVPEGCMLMDTAMARSGVWMCSESRVIDQGAASLLLPNEYVARVVNRLKRRNVEARHKLAGIEDNPAPLDARASDGDSHLDGESE